VSLDRLFRRPGYLFRRCRQLIMAKYLVRADGIDLTPQQYVVLQAASESEEIEQSALCAAILLDRSTVATILARLEEKGFIRRAPSAAHRRHNVIRTTPAGKRILTRVAPILDEVETELLAPLRADERKVFFELLDRIVAAGVDEQPMPDHFTKRAVRPRRSA
jgi:DNA-binding MarR family transcriptional regulator